MKRAGHTNNIPADLHFGQPAIDLALSWIDRRRLSLEYSHETGVGSQLSHHIPQYYPPRRKDRVPGPLTLRATLDDSEKRRKIPADLSSARGATGTSAAVVAAAVFWMTYICMASARFMPSVVPQRVPRLAPTDVLAFAAVLWYPSRGSGIDAA